jgi:hypothetical protein
VLGEQAYQEAEETGEHCEVLCADPVAYWVFVRVGRSPGVRRPVLRRVLGSSDALRRVADEVHYPEDAVAEQQGACEQHG